MLVIIETYPVKDVKDLTKLSSTAFRYLNLCMFYEEFDFPHPDGFVVGNFIFLFIHQNFLLQCRYLG